jgi:hypothetical protein
VPPFLDIGGGAGVGLISINDRALGGVA